MDSQKVEHILGISKQKMTSAKLQLPAEVDVTGTNCFEDQSIFYLVIHLIIITINLFFS